MCSLDFHHRPEIKKLRYLFRLVHLGKFGAFPASELLNLHYDITYEIVPGPPSTNGAGNAERTEGAETDRGHGELDDAAAAESTFGQKKGKRRKKGRGKDASGGNEGAVGFKTNPGWNKVLRPFKSMPLVDAIIGGPELSFLANS